MPPTATFSPPVFTLGDLLERLGGVSPDRVRLDPIPGTAQKADLLRLGQRENRLYELVDGVVVEKVANYRGSIVAGAIQTSLRAHIIPRNLGLVTGAKALVSGGVDADGLDVDVDLPDESYACSEVIVSPARHFCGRVAAAYHVNSQVRDKVRDGI